MGRRDDVHRDRVLCPDPHHWGPADRHAWATWAAEMARTHHQRDCPDCQLPVVWVPLDDLADPVDEPGLFDLEGPA